MDGPESNHERQFSRNMTTSIPVAESPTVTSRRLQRTRNACERCKTRKIKCDEGIPACSSCQKAGTACVTGSKPREQYSRAYISSLQDRIKWLEEIVATRCPDVELIHGSRIVNDARPSDEISMHGVPATPKSQQTSTVNEINHENLSHEIGLVSVTAGQDLRYVGPSSGYSFAKLVLASARLRRQHTNPRAQNFQSTLPLDKISFQVNPANMPSNSEQCTQLSAAYWENVHFQHPFLHQTTHMRLIEQMYDTGVPSPVAAFQIYMVLAISATILSRRLKAPLSAEGYCATAMSYIDQIQIEGSLEGLQCLLLLQMYALNNASMGLNVWYLNYQCIASVLDLGLQRDVRAGRNLSLLTQEMRTRIFWVVYSLDRSLATIMGRPIGLRDEACELRLPQDIDNDTLPGAGLRQGLDAYNPSNITISIHLIKLTQLNSEIKYIANSISRKTPPYSYPQVPDILAWKDDLLRRLQEWHSGIPQCHSSYVRNVVEIRYHEVMMLLLRPSPAITQPSHESLEICHQSAISVIRTFQELYSKDLLPYTWPTVHSVFLATISMLYCLWAVPRVTRATKLETLMTDLKLASGLLSALGEHWFEAKRSRVLLDELSQTTFRWLIECQDPGLTASVQPLPGPHNIPTRELQPTVSTSDDNRNRVQSQIIEEQVGLGSSTQFLDGILSSDTLTSMSSFPDEVHPAFDIDSIMQGIFSDCQLDVEFEQCFPLENQIMGGFAV